MRRPKDGLAGDRRAAAALEFALVTPLLLAMLLGIVGYSLYMAAQIAVVVAASEGARASVAGLSAAERGSLAQGTALAVLRNYAPLIVPGNAVVTAGAADANMFQVTVNYTLPNGPLGGFVPLPTRASFTASVANGGY